MTIETDRHKVIQTKTFRRIKRPDEEVKQWYSNGKLYFHESPDGESKEWYANGELKYHFSPFKGTFLRSIWLYIMDKLNKII